MCGVVCGVGSWWHMCTHPVALWQGVGGEMLGANCRWVEEGSPTVRDEANPAAKAPRPQKWQELTVGEVHGVAAACAPGSQRVGQRSGGVGVYELVRRGDHALDELAQARSLNCIGDARGMVLAEENRQRIAAVCLAIHNVHAGGLLTDSGGGVPQGTSSHQAHPCRRSR